MRQAKYDVDVAAMRPYFEAERVLRDGVFYAATRLYGITFTERPDLVAYHPDARVFEVTTKTARRSASTSSTSTPATRSAAARG